MHNRCIYPVPRTRGLRHQVLTCPGTGPSMQFLSVGSHLCARASFRPHLAVTPLPSASGYVSISDTPTGDFHPIRSCPCRAYTARSTRRAQERRAQVTVNVGPHEGGCALGKGCNRETDRSGHARRNRRSLLEQDTRILGETSATSPRRNRSHDRIAFPWSSSGRLGRCRRRPCNQYRCFCWWHFRHYSGPRDHASTMRPNPLLLRTGRQRSASAVIVVARRRTARYAP